MRVPGVTKSTREPELEELVKSQRSRVVLTQDKYHMVPSSKLPTR